MLFKIKKQLPHCKRFVTRLHTNRSSVFYPQQGIKSEKNFK